MALNGACGGITLKVCPAFTIKDEGIELGEANTLNFIGAGVTATVSGNDANITVTGGGSGSGTVESVSVVSANGFKGTVASATTTPKITIDVSALNATKIGPGTVDNTEFGFLNGVTSSIQTQFSGKQPNIQFQDEGVDIGVSGGITTINFTGPTVVASATGNVLTVRCSAAGGGSSGTVESVSVVSANGFFGSVASATTTPKITIDVSGLSTSKIAGGAFGRAFFATTTTAAAQNALEAGTVGLQIFKATTTAAVQAIIDASAKQNIIQFQDEGSNVGTAGGISTVNFTGAQVDTSATGSTLTVRVSATGGAGTPGGADTNVQYNDAGSFGGDANFTWSKSTRSLIINSSAAAAFSVGTNGATNPAFVVNCNTVGADNGVTVTGGTAGATLSTTGNDANLTFTLTTKGSGPLNLESASTGAVSLRPGGSDRLAMTATACTITPSALGTASTIRFSYVGAGNTSLTGGAEFIQTHINQGQTNQHASNTIITTQRDMLITGMNHSFVTSGGVITNCAALSLAWGNAGTNATITHNAAFYVPTQVLTGTVTNAYAIRLNAPTGATNNYVAALGNIFIDNADAIYGFQTKINDQASSYTLVSADTGQTIKINSATSASLNLPKEMPKGFTCEIIAYSSGAVVFVAASGATLQNRQGHTKIAGQYGAARIVVVSNSAGTNAFYNLAGDTAA